MAAISPEEAARAAADIEANIDKPQALDSTLQMMITQNWASRITVSVLQASKLGIAVAKVRKMPHPGLAAKASTLVTAWKELVTKTSEAEAKAAMQQQARSSSSSSGGASGSSSAARSSSSRVAEESSSEEHPYTRLWRRLGSAGDVAADDLYTELAYEYDDSAKVKESRCRELKRGDKAAVGPVIYWMNRDMRVADNWALLRAQEKAMAKKQPLVVVFCLAPSFLDATARAYGFMLRSLRQVERDCVRLGISFRLLMGDPGVQVAAYANALRAAHVVVDFNPVRICVEWRRVAAAGLWRSCVMEEVDAHNIIPVWITSSKLEVGARTIRKKVHMNLPDYCTPFPQLKDHPYPLPAAAEAGLATYTSAAEASASASASASSSSGSGPAQDADGCIAASVVRLAPRTASGSAASAGGAGSSTSAAATAASSGWTDWPVALTHLQIAVAGWSVPEISWASPGERAARHTMHAFITAKIKGYDDKRNDPTLNAQSNLSPWLHFGQLSAQRVILELMRHSGLKLRGLFPEAERTTDIHAFAEELVVRRELADNYCFYCKEYDQLDGASDWAQDTLRAHEKDKREFVYSLEAFEAGKTHEALWNAAQMQLVHSGKMHGFMRMYWAKKILEWSATPAEALRIAIFLNDRYSIDGRDPNGYVGCMWSVAGVHDMGWTERPVFGKIRYMNLAGCKRKFKVDTYIAQHPMKKLKDWGPPPAVTAAASSSK